MFDIPHPRISIFIILYISRIIGDIPLFIPAFPAILAAAGKSFKIPVDPKFFGMGSVHGNNFRLYFYLFFRNIQRAENRSGFHDFQRCSAQNDRVCRLVICYMDAVRKLANPFRHLFRFRIRQFIGFRCSSPIFHGGFPKNNKHAPLFPCYESLGNQHGMERFFRRDVI